MKAYVYGANGAAITDVPKRAPKGTQILVKVHACGLNRADLGMTKGHAHGAAGGVGTVLGMEWAGEVAELGPDAKGVKVGDKIMGSGGVASAAGFAPPGIGGGMSGAGLPSACNWARAPTTLARTSSSFCPRRAAMSA